MTTISSFFRGSSYIKADKTINLVTGTSSATFSFPVKCKGLYISASQDCYIRIDEDSVSSSNGFFIKAGALYNLEILYPAKISYIQSTAAGNLTILTY